MGTSNSIEKLFSVLVNSLSFRFFYFFLVFPVCSQIAVSQSVVKFLPGFDGPLPFYFETGYVGVGESDEVQLFYYFVKSESNPKEDPIVLWLTGGPGCTSFSGLIYEIGPLKFKGVQYNGSLPTLVLSPNPWTKVASILFLDQPVGTGFSYATTESASRTDDLQTSDHVSQFLRKWLIDHPEFVLNPIYIGGDSYSGITVPIVVQIMSNGNEAGIQPLINLKGYLLGNPITERDSEANYQIPYAHGMGLISDELYESLKTSCRGEYTNVDPSNAKCLQDVEVFSQLTSGIETGYILDPFCGLASPKPQKILFGKRRFLMEKLIKEPLNPQLSLSAFTCHIDWFLLYHPWISDVGVQEALHVRKGTKGTMKRCDHDIPYETTIRNSYPYHVNLSTKGYRSLIYSGDHDMIVPFLATQMWIRSLGYPIVDDWRPWTVQNQVGGYTRTYSNKMTFATVKGGGHTAPEYRPKECFAMFQRWIAQEPL